MVPSRFFSMALSYQAYDRTNKAKRSRATNLMTGRASAASRATTMSATRLRRQAQARTHRWFSFRQAVEEAQRLDVQVVLAGDGREVFATAHHVLAWTLAGFSGDGFGWLP